MLGYGFTPTRRKTMTAPKKKTKKQIIIDNLYLIDNMTSVSEIDSHRQKVSLSSLDGKDKGFIYRGCDVKENEISHKVSAMAVNGDLDDLV